MTESRDFRSIESLEDVMDAVSLYLKDRNVFKRGTNEAFEVRQLVYRLDGAFAALHARRLSQLLEGDVANAYHEHRD